jgi:hypothetical protein
MFQPCKVACSVWFYYLARNHNNVELLSWDLISHLRATSLALDEDETIQHWQQNVLMMMILLHYSSPQLSSQLSNECDELWLSDDDHLIEIMSVEKRMWEESLKFSKATLSKWNGKHRLECELNIIIFSATHKGWWRYTPRYSVRPSVRLSVCLSRLFLRRFASDWLQTFFRC